MPFKQTSQKFNAALRTVEVGTGDKKLVLGGENVLPFYTFDAPIENAPRIGVEISTLGLESYSKGLQEYYAGATTYAEIAKKASEMEGADFIAINMIAGDPNGEDMSLEELVSIAEEVAGATDLPIMIMGCNSHDKDAKLFDKVAATLEGKNIATMSAAEENYKLVGASVGMAYGQITGAESAVDINLAKQLNVLLTQLGVSADKILNNVGSAAAGYGFEYVVSTMDRIRLAALTQNDPMLQMPIVTPVSPDAWGVKEAVADEADFPEWGPADERGVRMEISTAASCLISGSHAVILRHPKSVATISKLIKELL